MLSVPSPADLLHQAACKARDRFWAHYGPPGGPCQALGLQPVRATYALQARVATEADRDRLPAWFDGFSVRTVVGVPLPQER